MWDWCEPWNSSSLNHCFPWSAQLSQVGWAGRCSDMPQSPGCLNPPFNLSQTRPSPWKWAFEVTCASHGMYLGQNKILMVVLMNCTGSCAHPGVLCQPEFLAQGCSWKTSRANPPLCWEHWADWDGQKERLALSDTAVLTFGVVLNSHWDSLYLKKSSDFLLVRLFSHRARQWELLWARHCSQQQLQRQKESLTFILIIFFLMSKSFEAVSLRVWIRPTSYERQCHWAKIRENYILYKNVGFILSK